MARRSLRTIAGLLANPRRRKHRRKNPGRTARGRFTRGRKHRKNPRRHRAGRTRSGRFTRRHRNPGRRRSAHRGRRHARRRRNPAYVLGPAKGRRNPRRGRRRSYRRNPFSLGGLRSSGKGFIGASVRMIPSLAVGGFAAPIAAIKAQAWLATKEWAAMFNSQHHYVRFGVLALLGSALTKMVARKVAPAYASELAVAAGAGIFGAGVGMQQAATTSAGALVFSGVPTGALAVGHQPYGQAAYQVGADTGAVVLSY